MTMPDKEFFDELRRQRRERQARNMQRFDPTGWSQHTEWHWWRWLNGERLDYWPSKAKWMYRNKVSTGDVNAFIASREGGNVPADEQAQEEGNR